jgi:hypothetical protein
MRTQLIKAGNEKDWIFFTGGEGKEDLELKFAAKNTEGIDMKQRTRRGRGLLTAGRKDEDNKSDLLRPSSLGRTGQASQNREGKEEEVAGFCGRNDGSS